MYRCLRAFHELCLSVVTFKPPTLDQFPIDQSRGYFLHGMTFFVSRFNGNLKELSRLNRLGRIQRPKDFHHWAEKIRDGSERVKSLGEGGRGAPAENNWGRTHQLHQQPAKYVCKYLVLLNFPPTNNNLHSVQKTKEQLFNWLIKYSLNINLVTIRN